MTGNEENSFKSTQPVVGRIVRRQRAMKSDDKLLSVAIGCQDRRHDTGQARDRDRLVSLQAQAFDPVALQILEEKISGASRAVSIERRRCASEHEPQQARAHMPIEEIVLELVLVAPQAAIARPITVVGAVLQDLQRILEDEKPEPDRPAGQSRRHRAGCRRGKISASRPSRPAAVSAGRYSACSSLASNSSLAHAAFVSASLIVRSATSVARRLGREREREAPR